MPTTPYAKILVSVNGAGPIDGGIDIPSECTIDFSGESTVGWLRARWEIYDYPEGWATPSGWSLASDGTIFNTDIPAPPQITMPNPADLWGVWMPRLLVNEQIDDSVNVLPNLLDDAVTALSMLSPSGLRSSGAREGQHFTTSTTRVKKWSRSYQRNLQALENPVISTTTPNNTPKTIRRYPIGDGSVKVLRAVVKVRDATGAIYGEYEVKGGWNQVASSGVITELYPPVITTVIESDAGLDVTIALDSNLAVLLQGTGIAATLLTWEAQEAFF